MRDYYNPCRIYCLNDEGGLVIAAWPEGVTRPTIPPPYSQETMNGFEYAAAIQMIQSGLVQEGMTAKGATPGTSSSVAATMPVLWPVTRCSTHSLGSSSIWCVGGLALTRFSFKTANSGAFGRWIRDGASSRSSPGNSRYVWRMVS